MDLGDQTHRIKFMIRDRRSNFTAAFDAILDGAGIRTVLCNVATPRMNAIAERWIGGRRRELLDRALIWNQAHLRQILRQYEAHHNQHRPHRSLHAAAPMKPLPEPVDLDQYRVRKQARVGGLINEYRLVAWRGRGFRHAQGPARQKAESALNDKKTPKINNWIHNSPITGFRTHLQNHCQLADRRVGFWNHCPRLRHRERFRDR
jgi:hypothetical protein